MTNKLNNINSTPNWEKNKLREFLKKVNDAVRNALASTAVVAQIWSPSASIGTSAVSSLPTAATVVTLWASSALLTACGPDEPEIRDTTPPKIDIINSEVDISGWKKVEISWNKLIIWWNIVASWSDDHTKDCKVQITMDWNTISSGSTINKAWTLTLKVSDNAGNTKTATIKLNVIDLNAPTINVTKPEINVFWWAKITISDDKLLLWDQEIANWSDKKTQKCKVSIKFNGQEVQSWDILNQEWKLSISITNDEWKTSTAEIKVINSAIFGLENLKNLNMQVDQTVNLLQWITFADWVSLAKTEILLDWNRTTISDASKYTPEYPWTCSIIFTVKTANWSTSEVKVDNLTIKSLEYKDPTLSKVDVINKQYSWYNKLRPETKEFIYPHILASYAACNLYKLNNLEYIIVWEVPNKYNVEDISQWASLPDSHATEWYRRIKTMAPESTIKACSSWRKDLESYVNQNPNKIIFSSCASDALWWRSLEQLKSYPGYDILKRLLEKENVIVCVAEGNRSGYTKRVLNEKISPEYSTDNYNSSSVNSKKNNKITVSWYDFRYKPYFSVDYDDDSNSTALPVWFKKEYWNILMPFIGLVREEWWGNKPDINTQSSYPTAGINATIWNLVSIVMWTHPWITAEDAMTIIVNNYLRAEKFKYKNNSWQIVDWDYRYFFDVNKLMKTELLQSSKINSIQLNWNDVALPNPKWICYTWKWIQFEYNGKRYNVSDQSTLNQALKSWNIKWYWNKKTFLKYGWKWSASFDVHLVDKDGKKIPDIEIKNITKTVK